MQRTLYDQDHEAFRQIPRRSRGRLWLPWLPSFRRVPPCNWPRVIPRNGTSSAGPAARPSVDAIEAVVDRAIEAHDDGQLSPADAASVKLFATDTASTIIDRCLQLHGGYGYMTEYQIARFYTDNRVTRIYGGTSEVMRSIIAK